MKKSYSWIEFLIGLVGVLIHTIVVLFIISYVLYPDALEVMIDVTQGDEQAMLMQFASDVNDLGFMVYAGSLIIIFEWLAIFKTKKLFNQYTPIWISFLILGSLYAYVYFGGLLAAVCLFLSGTINLIKYLVSKNSKV